MARGSSRGSVVVARDCVEYGVPDAWSYKWVGSSWVLRISDELRSTTQKPP